MAISLAQTLQQLFILATGKAANNANLAWLESTLGSGANFSQIDQTINQYMSTQARSVGVIGMIQAIARNGLGRELTVSEAEGAVRDLKAVGIDSWAKLLHWLVANETSLTTPLDNRAEAVAYFKTQLAEKGNGHLFDGASLTSAVGNLLQGIGASLQSVENSRQGLAQLAANLGPDGITSSVVDGYIAGASVFADANGDGLLNFTDTDNDGGWDAGEGEWNGTTDANGNYVLPTNAPAGVINASGGIDILTNKPFLGVLTAPAGSTVVNPLTTLVQGLIESGSSVAQACAIIQQGLDLPVDINLLSYNPLLDLASSTASAEDKAIALAVQTIALQIMNVITQVGNAIATTTGISVQDAGKDVAAALANNIKTAVATGGSEATVDLTDAAVITEVVQSSAPGALITSVINNVTSIVVASNNSAAEATNITELSKAAVVSQGDATNAIISGITNNTLGTAVTNFTGTNLDTKVDVAVPGVLTNEPAPDPTAIFGVTESPAGTWTVSTDNGNVVITDTGTNYLFTPTTGTAVSVLKTAVTTSLVVGSITLSGAAVVVKSLPAITGSVTVSDAGTVTAADLNTIDTLTSGLVIATAATTISGTAAAITTTIVTNQGTSGNKIQTSADLSATVTDVGSIAATALNAVDTATTGIVVASGITAITGTAAQNKAVTDALGTTGNKISLGTMTGSITDAAITITDSSVTLANLKSIEAATSGLVTATAVTATSGTASDATLLLVTNEGLSGNKIDMKADVAVTLSDSGSIAATALSSINGGTTGLVTAASITTVTGSSTEIKAIVDALGTSGDVLSVGTMTGSVTNAALTATTGSLIASDVSAILAASSGAVTVRLVNTYITGSSFTVASGDIINIDPFNVTTALDATAQADVGSVDTSGEWFFDTTSKLFTWFDDDEPAVNSVTLTGAEAISVGGDLVTISNATFTVINTSGVITFGGNATGDITLAIAGGTGTFTRQSVAAETTVPDIESAATIEGGAGDDILELTTTLSSLTFDGKGGNDKLILANVDNTANLTLIDVESVDGGSGIDTLTLTNSTGVVIDGKANDDVITGGTGDDSITGGAGTDSVIGGDGSDSFYFDSGEFIAGETVSGGDGIDAIVFTADSQTIVDADFENKTLIEAIFLGNGTNSLTMGAMASDATNNLTIIGGSGDDTIDLSAHDGAASINAGNGTNVVTGTNSDDTIIGGTGSDTITGGGGYDNISGGNGANLFVFSINQLTSDVTVTGGTGIDTVRFTDAGTITDANFTSATSIDVLTLSDGTNNITLGSNVAAATANLTVNGGTGSDTIDASALGEAVTIDGDAGSDVILGSNQGDVISGGDDDDTITGGGGSDDLSGGDGEDTFVFTGKTQLSAATNVYGGAGTADTIFIDEAATDIVDDNFAYVDEVEYLVLTGASTVVLGYNAANTADITTIFTGTGNTSITSAEADPFTVNAAALGAAATLTLTSNGAMTVTELTGSLVSNTTSALNVTTADALDNSISITTGSGTTNLTANNASDIVEVDATALANNTALTVAAASASALTVTGLKGNLVATNLTGALTVTTADALDNSISITTGSGATNLTANHASDTVTVNATALANNTALTVAATSASALTVTGLKGNLVATNLTGALIVTTVDNIVDNTISITTGIAATSVNVAAGALTDTVTIAATALANDTVLTVTSGGAAAGIVNITGLTGDLVVSNPTSGSIGVALGDNTDDNDISIVAGAADLAITNAFATDTVFVTGFIGDRFTGTTATSGRYDVTAGAGDQEIYTSVGNDTITGGAGADILSSSNGADVFIIAVASDHATGESINGGAQTDVIRFTSTVSGTLVLDSNLINVEEARITDAAGVATGTTNESIDAAAVSIAIALHGNDGNNSLTGNSEANVIFGNDGDDTITGGVGSDAISGGAGANRYLYGNGEFVADETVTGGSNVDSVIFTADTQTIADSAFTNKTLIEAIILANGTNSLTLGTNAAAASASLTVTGGTGADTINASGLGEAVNINGGLGANVLTGSNQADTINGGAEADTITGGAGSDNLSGGNGANSYRYGNGEFVAGDTVTGGSGVDSIVFTADAQTVADTSFANKTLIEAIILANGTNSLTLGTNAAAASASLIVTGGTGADTIDASTLGEAVYINGGIGANVLTGSNQADTIIGGAADETITGGAGSDNLSGGNGANIYFYGDGEFIADETLTGGSGVDSIVFTADSQTVADSAFTNKTLIEEIFLANGINSVTLGTNAAAASAGLMVYGGIGADTINASALGESVSVYGGGGHDFLFGSNQNDTINGNAGNDTIVGGAGADALYGGSGDNTFVFASGSELAGDSYVVGGSGTDTIEFLSAGTITDNNFFNIAGDSIEKIELADGTNDFELGSNVHYGTQTLTVMGGTGADTINAYWLDETVTIDGGDGDDQITGSSEADNLSGGEGADNFIYDVEFRSTDQFSVDSIQDFTDMDGLTFTALNMDDLRGTGEFYEIGDGTSFSLYDDTGFFVATNTVASFDEANIYSALSGIADSLNLGDVIYAAISDGIDSVIVRISNDIASNELSVNNDTMEFVVTLVGVDTTELGGLSIPDFGLVG